jgi:hypothetical protein
MLLHEGHLDEGNTIDWFLGILYIQTFRKEPIIAPKIQTEKYNKYT